MVAEQKLFSLAKIIATSEDLEALRADLGRLRQEIEGFLASEAGVRLALREELFSQVREVKDALAAGEWLPASQGRLQGIEQLAEKLPDPAEFYAHMSAMGTKMEEDGATAQRQHAQLMDIAKESADNTSSHAYQASAFPPGQHLTQRKGFEGPPTYSDGAQLQDWRFTTADWLRQEHPDFESLLEKIERMTEEPEEPA